MIIKKEDILNLSNEQIRALPLSDLAPYVSRANDGILTQVATELGIEIPYVSMIIKGVRKGKLYRKVIDARVRELLQIYINNNIKELQKS